MIHWGLRNKILLLALLPSIAVSLLLGSYLSYSRLVDLEDFIVDRGTASSQQLGIIAQHSVANNQHALLQSIANATLEENGVRAVTFYNRQQLVLVHAGPKMRQPGTEKPSDRDTTFGQATISGQTVFGQTVFGQTTTTRYSDNTIRFVSPIRIGNLISDNISLTSPVSSDNIIGWVEMEYSKDSASLKKYQTILVSSILILVALLITGIITLRISQQVIEAIQELINGIKSIKKNKYDISINLEHGGELSLLAHEINEMASAIESSFNDMQNNVEQTTSDLRETLETIEIQNIELDLARKEAVEGSRIKSEFLANTSHEVRTPLNGIIGFTHLLLKSDLSSEQRDYLETIEQSSEGLLTIINDILDFSKIEAGKLVLDHVPINLRELIEDTLTMLAPSAYGKGLELILLIYADVPVNLIGDPLRIKQVITNLVNNAIKFTEHGNIIVRVNLENQKEDQIHLTISITDSGIGLSPQQQRDLFNAFTQGDTSTSREFGGTGLGLVISKRLVEQMGGDISIESEVAKGSTFKFSLKVKLADCPIDPISTQLHGRHVLLYETNPVLQLSLKYLLESWQIQVHCLDSENGDHLGAESLQGVSAHHTIDAIVVGINHHQLQDKPTTIPETLIDFFQKPVLLLAPSSTMLPSISHTSSPLLSVLAKPTPANKLLRKLHQLIYPQSNDFTNNFTNHFTNHFTNNVTSNVLQGTDRVHRYSSVTPRILAVDDNAANLKLLSVLLTDLGIEVTQASSGFQTLQLVEHNHFDMIFMDIQMPEMDGVETTRRIRTMPDRIANIPIVALTAHAMAEERQQLLKSGLNDHLTKPINEKQLQQIIRRWCNTVQANDFNPYATVSASGIFVNQAKLSIDSSSECTTMRDRPVEISLCLQLANHKHDLARDMLSMLLERLPEEESTIRQCYQNLDQQGLLDCVHKLHGATCYTGVPALKIVTDELETAIKLRGMHDIEQLVQQLLNETGRLVQWSDQHDIDSLFAPETTIVEN